MGPTVISDHVEGRHNADLRQTIKRLEQTAAHKDLSCVLIMPAHRGIAPRIVHNWMGLFSPPNQKFVRHMAEGMEVGEAYSRTIEQILGHPELSKFKFIVTLEIDNAPPQDGLVRLLSSAHAHPEFAAIGGLYFTKGAGGVAQIWGDPNDHPINFRPQLPDQSGGLKECNGTGMGFTCFRTKMFKDEKLRRPWFKTAASKEEGVATQDLYAWADFRRHGYRCAIDCSILVGHLDENTGIMW
jgi:hypothetical protein